MIRNLHFFVAGSLLIFFACAPGPLLLQSMPDNHHFTEQSFALTKNDVARLSNKILKTFNNTYDSLTDAAAVSELKPDSTGTDSLINILARFKSSLRQQKLTLCRMINPTYESLRALYNVPVVCIAKVYEYDKKTKVFASRREIAKAPFTDGNTTPALYNNRILYCITGMIESEQGYSILLGTSDTLTGFTADTIAGQIFLSSTNTYMQIVDLLIVSSFPLHELRAALDDWYNQKPAGTYKPQIANW